LGDIRNVQIIEAGGENRFLIDAEREGCFHLITGPDQNLDPMRSLFDGNAPAQDGIPQGEILLAQGYASGASLHTATGKPVAVTFTADNLEPVAKTLREQFPQASITICPDNNQYERTDGTVFNRGVIEAEKAAQAVGGRVVVPEFTENEKSRSLVDFNDLHVSRGFGEVNRQMDAPVLEKAPEKERKAGKSRKKGKGGPEL
jgi:phage/plasmid primase-like uncharacterized protein